MKWEDQRDVCNSSLVQQELSTPLIGLQLQQVSAWNQHCNNMQLVLFHNLHWKLGRLTPSFGSNLAVRLKKYFFRNTTFLFFKIESWNFQHLFEIKFCETSQNFNSISLFGQLFFSFFLSVVWLSWNFVRFHKIFFQTDA